MRYETIKSVILTILALLSIVLTYNLWTYQPAYDTIDNNYIHEISISEKRDISDVVRPTLLLFHKYGYHYGTVQPNVIEKFIQMMKKWDLYDWQNLSEELNSSEFFSLVHGDQRIEIVFPDIVPFDVFNSVISIDDDSLSNSSFDRLIIEINESNKHEADVYFVNYEERHVIEAQLESPLSYPFLASTWEKAEDYTRYFDYDVQGIRKLFLPQDALKFSVIKYYTYVINPDKFKLALFSDPSFVTKDLLDQGDQYTDGTSMMNVDYQRSLITYVNPANNRVSFSMLKNGDLLQQTIDFINDHGGWTDDYLYFGMSPAEQKVSFRLFIDGFPVFNEEGMAEIMEFWGNNEIYKYVRPFYTLNLPLTAEHITLPSGYEMLDQLVNRPDFELEYLEDVTIGYKMYRDPQTPKVLIFEPSWYYRYGGSWLRLTSDEEVTNRGLE
jgi:regulatory protein YycH of two-component signal transduction system YycFG